MLESLLSHQYKLYQHSVIPSLTFLEQGRTYLVWFQLQSIKILTLEWRVMLHKNLNTKNLHQFTALSSQLFRVKRLRCHQVILTVESVWLINQMKLRKKWINMLSLAVNQLSKNKELKVLILKSMYHISICNSLWRMMMNLQKSVENTKVVKWWQERSNKFWLKSYNSLLLIFKLEERKSQIKMLNYLC